MRAKFLGVVVMWASGAAAPACGPFFPDTVLDSPDAVLDVPPVSYLHELAGITGVAVPAAIVSGVDLSSQIPLEIAELEAVWRSESVAADEIARRSEDYRALRSRLLRCFDPAGEDGLAAEGKHDGPPETGLDARFPKDVIDYVEASRRFAGGDKAGARALWREIVARPAAEKRFRGAWAAWMLGRTAADEAEAVRWYREVIDEVRGGAGDPLGLQGAAFGWLATLDGKDDPVKAIQLGVQAVKLGHFRSVIDLRRRCGRMLGEEDAGVLAAAAADDDVRQLVNLQLYAIQDGPTYGFIGATPENPFGRWLDALAASGEPTDRECVRIAWALYSLGRFDECRAWLDRAAADSPRAAWLRGKLALRDGRIEDARTDLARAAEMARRMDHWHPDNPVLESLWASAGDERHAASQGRLLAELGSVELSRGEYAGALDALAEGGYWEDAAYVAERVLSADELMAHLRSAASDWSPAIRAYWAGEEWRTEYGGTYRYGGHVDPSHFLGPREDAWQGPLAMHDHLRYLLARRLAREWRFDDARAWMPPPYLALFEHYVALHRARRSGRYSGEMLAAIAWRQALIHREWGAELFGTESAPDAGARFWSFEMSDVGRLRAHWNGVKRMTEEELAESFWRSGLDTAPTPPVSGDEARRVLKHTLPEGKRKRFHYRHTAAEIAWEAARALPRGHPQLAALYNTAGLWIADRDPAAADRFYQAMVRRCAGTEAGRRADAKRWFLRDLAPPAEWQALPSSLMPK